MTLHLDPDGTALYHCVVVMYPDDPPRVHSFNLRHRYDDGALVLASKLLATAVAERTARR